MEITPTAFIEKWRDNPLTERQASHTHFIDLCHLLGEPAPYDPGTDPETYCFEKGAAKSTGAEGWADVWKRGAFGWEYKGPKRTLLRPMPSFSNMPSRWKIRLCLWFATASAFASIPILQTA